MLKTVALLGVILFAGVKYAGSNIENGSSVESELKFDEKKWVGAWVDMWNAYDLSQVKKLFLQDEELTYFSSEKEGVVKGIDAVLDHHKGFGFVEGGKVQDNKLWVENLYTAEFGSTAVVTGIWYFQRPSGRLQRGPVTFVYVRKEDEYRLAHLHFANYKDPE